MEKNNVAAPTEGWVVAWSPKKDEYRCVDIKEHSVVFKSHIGDCPKDIAEFLSIIHAILHREKLSQNGKTRNIAIYTDNMNAMTLIYGAYVTEGVLKKLDPLIWDKMNKALAWLKTNRFNYKVIGWKTGIWGQNPARY